jgi:hypothetical protein
MAMGFQSLGSSPCWTRRSGKPAMRLAAAGNALMSRRDDPSHGRRSSIHYEYRSSSMAP